MLGHIRKRVQERRQQSVETRQASKMSPCNSPLTTPTNELPPKFPWLSQSNSLETDEPMDLCEIYKTPTQKAVPLDGYDGHVNGERPETKGTEGKDLRSRRHHARKLRLQLSKSGSKLERQQSTQHRDAYFLRSSSVDMKDVN